MTKRFTDNMITGKIAIVNDTLKEMGFKFRVGIESQKPDNKRIHRFFTRDNKSEGDHDLTYPYGQDTGNAYLTMRAIHHLLGIMQAEMKEAEEQ